MRNIFDLDGPFNKYGGLLADTVIVSIMWILFSIPLITIGASTTAMFFVTTRRIANREGYITSDFWQAFKDNFGKATVLWLFVVILYAILLFNILNMGAVGNFSVWLAPAQLIMMLIIALMCMFMFPMCARFQMGAFQIIKSSFFMAIRHLFTSLTCLILLFALIMTMFFTEIMVFFIPGIFGMLSSHLIMRVFKKYRPEMDKDPILEIQEIEAKKAEERRQRDIRIAEGEETEETGEEETDDNI